jgi:hypothetical protein
MIKQADIGVGISGIEGLQAAREASYSIGSKHFYIFCLYNHDVFTSPCTHFLNPLFLLFLR